MATEITAQSIINKLNVRQTLNEKEKQYLKDNQNISSEVDKHYDVGSLLNGKVIPKTSAAGASSSGTPTQNNGTIPLNGANANPSLNPLDTFNRSNNAPAATNTPSAAQASPMAPTNLPTAIQGAVDTLNKSGGAEKQKALQDLYAAKSALQAMDEKSNDATKPLEASKVQLSQQEKDDAAKVSSSGEKVQVSDKDMQEAQALKQRVESEKAKVEGELQTAKTTLGKTKGELTQAKENVTKGKTAKSNCETKLKDSTAAYNSAKQATAQAQAANNPSTPATSAALMKAQSQEKVAEAQMKADEVALKKAEAELKQFEAEEKKAQAKFDKDTATVEKLDKALNGTKEEVAQAIAKEDKATQDLSLAQSEQTEANRLLDTTKGANQNNEASLNQAISAVSQQRKDLIAQIDAQIKALGGETGEKQGILAKTGSFLGGLFGGGSNSSNGMGNLGNMAMMAYMMNGGFGQQNNGQGTMNYNGSGLPPMGNNYRPITQEDADRVNNLTASYDGAWSRGEVNQNSAPGLNGIYGGTSTTKLTNIAKLDIGGAGVAKVNSPAVTGGDSVFTQAKAAKKPSTGTT